MKRRTIAIALAIALAVGLAACGSLDQGTGGDTSTASLSTSSTTKTTPSADLPQPKSGIVQVDGDFNNTVTQKVDKKFQNKTTNNGVAVRVDERPSDDATSLANLCDGGTDIAVTSRRITDAELAACGANGLQVVDFAVAYDAIVIATENERDVGADCVNLTQLRQMFGAGSPVTSWSELNPNFYVLRIRPTGPQDGTPDFDYFGSRVLGVPDPTLANYVSTYRPFKREVQAKNYVAGREDAAAFKKAGKRVKDTLAKLPPAKRELRRSTHALKRATKAYKKAGRQLDAAGKTLDATVRAQDRVAQANAEAVHNQAVKNWKRARHFYKLAKERQKKASDTVKRLSRRADRAVQTQRRADRMVPPGAVGIFSFSFYELWEEKLRPLEIDGQTGDRCVFPSEETISNELYPLERTIRIYTTERSLRRPEVQTYIGYHLNQAPAIAKELDLIPLPDATLQEELAKIRNPVATQTSAEQAGTTSSTGSTSSSTSTTTGSTTSTTTGTTSTTTDNTGSTTSTGAGDTTTSTTTTTGG